MRHILKRLSNWWGKPYPTNGALFLAVLLSATFASIFGVLAVRADMNGALNRALDELTPAAQGIYAYLATSTEEEFNEVTQELRRSIVLRSLRSEDAQWIDILPNSCEQCPLDQASYDAQAYLFSLNTGALYDLDIYSYRMPPLEAGEEGYGIFTTRGGYDEISDTSFTMVCDPDNKTATGYLTRRSSKLSIHRLKANACDACIHELIEALEGHTTLEWAIFDASGHRFFPIVEGADYEIGDYAISIGPGLGDSLIDYSIKTIYIK